ncbi:hypothetical protein ACIQ9P_38750 [Kitasatospora sp. NPDC094019]|uniref:hypothetical protein n=1 Tax=Kitasatospora sp. NPDC094019 TaxID=3364091 RepID=UPI00380EEDB5
MPTRDRILDLIALVLRLAAATTVFVLVGTGAFTAVTSVGMGLYATWRTRR